MNALIERVVEAIRGVSIHQLKHLSGRLDLKQVPLENSLSWNTDHWIYSIQVGGPGLKVSFETHFTTQATRELVGDFFVGKTELTPDFCHSFVGEFSNLVGGAIREVLRSTLSEDSGALMGFRQTLPERRPSFDLGLKGPEAMGPCQKSESWELTFSERSLACVVSVEGSPELLTAMGVNLGNIAPILERLDSWSIGGDLNIELL